MKKSFIISFFVTIFFLGIGFLFLHFDLVDYGYVFFGLLPLALGVSIGAMPVRAWSYLGLTFAFILFLILLYFGKLEGMVCLLMALPIIIPLLIIGILINRFLIKKGIIKPTNKFNILITPLIVVLIAAPIEKTINNSNEHIIEISTEIILPYSPMQVYDAIKSVDTLDVERSFLMKLDLPIPLKCVLEDEKVGGIRTCYFKEGLIVERITQLEKGKILKMDVIDYQLTGRNWFKFKEAIYTFEELKNGGCKMIRITTYTSELSPRFYWQPLEAIGIEQEHDYVFRNLKKDLSQIH